MKNKICVIVVISIFIAISGIYLFYCFNAGMIFTRAIQYGIKDHPQSSWIAHQFVITKYPFSPFASASRFILYSDEQFDEYKGKTLNINTEQLSFIRDIPVVDSWSPYRVDFFALLAILVFGFFAIFCRPPFSFKKKKHSPGARFFMILVFIISVPVFITWASSVSGKPVWKGTYFFWRDIGALDYSGVIIGSTIWAGYGLLLLLWGIKSLFSGKKIEDEDAIVKSPEQSPEKPEPEKYTPVPPVKESEEKRPEEEKLPAPPPLVPVVAPIRKSQEPIRFSQESVKPGTIAPERKLESEKYSSDRPPSLDDRREKLKRDEDAVKNRLKRMEEELKRKYNNNKLS